MRLNNCIKTKFSCANLNYSLKSQPVSNSNERLNDKFGLLLSYCLSWLVPKTQNIHIIVFNIDHNSANSPTLMAACSDHRSIVLETSEANQMPSVDCSELGCASTHRIEVVPGIKVHVRYHKALINSQSLRFILLGIFI